MSSDKQITEVLDKVCGGKVVFFDMVQLYLPNATEDFEEQDAVADSHRYAAPIKACLCVGWAALYLVRSNMSRLIQGGEIAWEHIEKLIEDKGGGNRFAIELKRKRPKGIPREFMVESDFRRALLKRIEEGFVAAMLQYNTIVMLPRSSEDMFTRSTPLSIAPFKGYQEKQFMGYRFFLRDCFHDVPSLISKDQSGVYGAELAALLGSSSKSWNPFSSEKKGPQVELMLNIFDPFPLLELPKIGCEHVRWVASRFKGEVAERSTGTKVLRSQPYLKKMNLANDMAAWSGWELMIQDADFIWTIILLRRTYLPPLMDHVQDFALTLKTPRNAAEKEKVKVEMLHREFYLAADTFCTDVHPNIYKDLLQVKLDALLFNEDAYHWIEQQLGLRPGGAPEAHKYGCIFVKGVVMLLYKEMALNANELVQEVIHLVDDVTDSIADKDLDPLQAWRLLKEPGQGLPRSPNPGTAAYACLNAWQTRVTRYLAFCLDGFICGSRLTLVDVINAARLQTVSEEGRKTCELILGLALHARSTDLRVPWEVKGVLSQLMGVGLLSHMDFPTSGGFEDDAESKENFTFNDRVMQVMIDSGYIRELSEDPDAGGPGFMSMEFAHLLRNLMMSKAASTSLKASICRLIVQDKAVGFKGQARLLGEGLLHLMQSGTIFLATYAAAASVNLCQSLEAVKGHLMERGISEICLKSLRSNDSDLMLYTLMLLVHLTKRSHFRLKLRAAGLPDQLARLYNEIYKDIDDRRRILTEMCSVMGQLANDTLCASTLMSKPYEAHTKMVTMFLTAVKLPGKRKPGELIPEEFVKILSKAMYALRTFAHDVKLKDEIGEKIVEPLIKDLQEQENCNRTDWAANAVLFVFAMTMSKKMTQKMDECGWPNARRALLASSMGQLDIFVQRIRTIQAAVVAVRDKTGGATSPSKSPATGNSFSAGK
mmetsp:Transcript_82799/g.146288  ORF Transcript_82799/g.146288 Transcript_82799/m.146288 type:complete len:938 (-) Transcript_82799:39-2852(-)